MGQTAPLEVRDQEIAQSKLSGKTYREMEVIHGVSRGTIGRTLNKPEIKDIIDTGTSEIISLIPKAIDIQFKAMDSKDSDSNPTALALKASENILKTGAIIPSNVTNNTVNQVFNIQNNVTLAPGVAKAMGMTLDNGDDDVIDVIPEDE